MAMIKLSTAKLVVALPLIITWIALLSCLFPSSESRTVAPRWGNLGRMVANDTDFNVSRSRHWSRSGELDAASGDASVQRNCNSDCNDERCNHYYPDQCKDFVPPGAVDGDVYICWVGCDCEQNKCVCLWRRRGS